MIHIDIKQLPNGEGLPLPDYATEHSAGMDLYAAITDPITLKPLQRALVPSGISVALPGGMEGQVRPRSGLASKHGITILNSPGTIDADYRGEIIALLINLGQEDFTITRGMRIAQLVFAVHSKVKWRLVNKLAPTLRGIGGFGSTGHGAEA